MVFDQWVRYGIVWVQTDWFQSRTKVARCKNAKPQIKFYLVQLHLNNKTVYLEDT